MAEDRLGAHEGCMMFQLKVINQHCVRHGCCVSHYDGMMGESLCFWLHL